MATAAAMPRRLRSSWADGAFFAPGLSASTSSSRRRSSSPRARSWSARASVPAARSAFESAIVWFWHTRQRSSEAMSMTRFSRTGFSWEKTRLENKKQKAKAPLFTLQLLDERQDALLHHLGRHRADLLVADDAFLVDHVGLGHAVDAVVDADPAVGVEERGAAWVAVALEPAHAG